MNAHPNGSAAADVAALAKRLDALLATAGLGHDEFASALLAAVEERGLPDCAQACGISCVNLERQSSGRRGLSFGTVIRVTRVLGLQVGVDVKQ